MQSSNLHNWVQSIASVGVIAGLLLVAYELSQNTQQLYGEAIRGIHASYRTRAVIEVETDIVELQLKSFENPEELSAEEIMKLSAFLTLVVDEYSEWENMYEIGVVRYSGAENITPEVDFHFASQFGRAWFAHNKNWIKPSIVEVMERELMARPVLEEPPDVTAIKSQLRTAN